MRFHLLLPALLAALPTRAQTPPAPRWHLSAQAIYQRFNVLGGRPEYDSGVTPALGPLLSGGYHFSPRISLTLGAGLSYRSGHRVYRSFYDIPESCSYANLRTYTLFVPLLVHTQLLHRPGPWGLESEAGLALVQQYSAIELLDNACAPSPRQMQRSGFFTGYRDVPAVVGLSLTRRLAPHWQAVAQAQAVFSFRYLFAAVSDNGPRAFLPTGGSSLGLRYNW